MPRRDVLSCAGALLLALAVSSAFAEVTARTEPLTLPWFTSTPNVKADPKHPKPLQPAKDSQKEAAPRTFETVVLENQFLRVQAIPELGGVVYRAIDKSANGGKGSDLFYCENRAKDWLPWWESGVKLSFPYFEHGLSTDDQPASYRIVKNADGSATLAQFMEFSRHNEPYQRKRYGRFSTMMVTQLVTLRPDEATFSVTYRLYNPSPFKQGRRIWCDTLLPRNDTPEGPIQGAAGPPAKTLAEWVFPATWVSDHGGANLREYGGKTKLADYVGGSYSVFAWDMPYGFAGLYYPNTNTNRLRITDPKLAPGFKQWFIGDRKPADTAPAKPNQMFNYVELWGGTDDIFEAVEHWIGPGEVFSFTNHYLLAQGAGKALYADEKVVLGYDPNGGAIGGGALDTLQVMPTRPVQRLVLSVEGTEKGTAENVGPAKPMGFSFLPRGELLKQARHIVITADGKTLYDGLFPPPAPKEPTAKHEAIKTALKNPHYAEMKGNADENGQNFETALKTYPDGSTDKGRVLYRAGKLDDAIASLEKATAADGADGEAWHLLGVALLEKGKRDEARAAMEKAIGAKNAYPPARYYLALTDLAAGRKDAAAGQLESLVQADPADWSARLLLAALRPASAKALAAEDPADPRAVWVAFRALDADAKPALVAAALAALLKEPGAQARLDAFIAATQGKFTPPPRLQE